jgi:hypothetical protein
MASFDTSSHSTKYWTLNPYIIPIYPFFHFSQAEQLLDNKPEGTFLLRDSAQEDYLFSVSFRRYSRSLHARIEQWNHKFSFDSHDPGACKIKTNLLFFDLSNI